MTQLELEHSSREHTSQPSSLNGSSVGRVGSLLDKASHWAARKSHLLAYCCSSLAQTGGASRSGRPLQPHSHVATLSLLTLQISLPGVLQALAAQGFLSVSAHVALFMTQSQRKPMGSHVKVVSSHGFLGIARSHEPCLEQSSTFCWQIPSLHSNPVLQRVKMWSPHTSPSSATVARHFEHSSQPIRLLGVKVLLQGRGAQAGLVLAHGSVSSSWHRLHFSHPLWSSWSSLQPVHSNLHLSGSSALHISLPLNPTQKHPSRTHEADSVFP